MAEVICPPLGTGSVDMNALHDAAKKLERGGKGGDLTEAMAAATTVVEAPPEDAAPAADPSPAPDAGAAA